MFHLKIPQSIFVHADGFLKASIPKTDPPHPLDMIVLVTTCAFAIELYLKCLIHVESGQLMKYEHNLRNIFSKVSAEKQAEIARRFEAILAQEKPFDFSKAPNPEMAKKVADMRPTTLRDSLKAGEDAFVEWRYLYEDDSGEAVFSFNLFPLPGILRAIILEMKPEWARFQIKMTKIGSAQPTSPAQKKPEQADTAE